MKNSSKSALPIRVWTVLMLAGAVAAIEPVSAATNPNAGRVEVAIQLLDESLHENFSGRIPTGKVQNYAGSANIGRIDATLDRADALIVGDNKHEAIVASALNKMLTAETMVYDLKFDSPAEEFQHVQARNRSYQELILIALAQRISSRDMVQKQAGGGVYQAAVKTIQEATSHLQRSFENRGRGRAAVSRNHALRPL